MITISNNYRLNNIEIFLLNVLEISHRNIFIRLNDMPVETEML